MRVRARQSLTGSPPVPASRAAAAAPQLHPRPGPAPGPSPAAPHGAVSHRRAGVCGGEHPEEARAEGEAARGRLPRRGEVASCSPAPPPPGRAERKVVRGTPGDPALLGRPHSPVPHFPRHCGGPVELKLLSRDAGASEAVWDGDEDGTRNSELHSASFPLRSVSRRLKLKLRKQLASALESK